MERSRAVVFNMHEDYTARVAVSNEPTGFAALKNFTYELLPMASSVGVSSGPSVPAPLAGAGSVGPFAFGLDCITPVASEKATPLNDMGSPHTSALIDYLSFTFSNPFPVADVLELLAPVVHPAMDTQEAADASAWVSLGYGLNGYKSAFQRGKISVYYDGLPEMGVNVMISGQGCRQLESEQGFQGEKCWIAFFNLLISKGATFRRCDAAIDDHEGLLDLDTIQAAIDNGLLTSLWRTSSTVREKRLGRLREGETVAAQTSNTIYLGSKRNSNMFARIYNKHLEQLNKLGFEPPVGEAAPHWVRCEVCARAAKADELVKVICEQGFACAASVLRAYVDFKECNPNDTNQSRWPTAPWWLAFLDGAEKRPLSVAPAVPSLEKLVGWLRKQVGVTLALIVEASGGSFDELVSIASEGRKRYQAHHRAMLAAHVKAFGAGGGSSGFWCPPGSVEGVLNV